MARTRTTPETRADIALDTIESFGLTMRYDASGVSDTSRVSFRYTVNNRLADGTVVATQSSAQLHADWTAGLESAIETFYAAVLTDAEAKGLIGAGTDSDDFPNV